MARLPRTISFNRFSEMPSRRAASSCPRPSGFRYSSSRSSPGGIAGPSQFGSLVIVFDADFVRMSVLPSQSDPVLLIDADAVTPRLVAFQQLQAIPCGNSEILQPSGHVDEFKLPVDRPPQPPRNPAS